MWSGGSQAGKENGLDDVERKTVHYFTVSLFDISARRAGADAALNWEIEEGLKLSGPEC
jgi:hypothetical protein